MTDEQTAALRAAISRYLTEFKNVQDYFDRNRKLWEWIEVFGAEWTVETLGDADERQIIGLLEALHNTQDLPFRIQDVLEANTWLEVRLSFIAMADETLGLDERLEMARRPHLATSSLTEFLGFFAPAKYPIMNKRSSGGMGGLLGRPMGADKVPYSLFAAYCDEGVQMFGELVLARFRDDPDLAPLREALDEIPFLLFDQCLAYYYNVWNQKRQIWDLA